MNIIHEMQTWPIYPTLEGGMIAMGALALGLLTHVVAFRLLLRLSAATESTLDDLIAKHCRAPSRLLFPIIGVNLSIPLLLLAPRLASLLRHLVSLGMVIGVTWLLIRLSRVFVDAVLARYDLMTENNLQSRKVHTQLGILQRIVTVVIVILGAAGALMTFERVRQLGTSILASAGIAGVILGFAAQKTLANLIAGVQIAISQPIRIDDVVIVENEWGRIEEITFTYVVIRIWDLRRLVVPISYFVEKPFQNWTRTSAELLGTVFLHTDHTVPFDAIRGALERICEASALWDRKVCLLQVTNSSEKAIELRALVSAKDAGQAWDLRCEVREKLIDFIQREYPDSLPRLRAEVGGLTPQFPQP